MAVYPRLLDETAIGFPVIQYRETDWEFIGVWRAGLAWQSTRRQRWEAES